MQKGYSLIIIVIISISISLSACASATQSNSLDGKALMEAKCSTCHSVDRVKNTKKTQSEWSNVILRMVGLGLEVTDAEKEAVITYLAETYR
ncbi:MAG: hypothetical protein C0391_08685 [Anaerolinea sp.]|nr:hypothetical protein [Anaerolinea sp.]